MTIEKAILVLAGSVVMISALLSKYHDPLWIWLTIFVGFNLLQSAFTGFCPPAILMKKMGMKSDKDSA
ncbi:MAG: DUF2892 domain-containing protein [Gammaproteobacteria bacterium]|nr:DUF2892 domain-containing protein [Gammaproteobacteria bacterium]